MGIHGTTWAYTGVLFVSPYKGGPSIPLGVVGVALLCGPQMTGQADVRPAKSVAVWIGNGGGFCRVVWVVSSWPAPVLQLKESGWSRMLWHPCGTADCHAALCWADCSHVLWLMLNAFSEAFSVSLNRFFWPPW